MVIGIDSYHDSAQRNMTVLSTVSSVNPYLTKYFSQVMFQPKREEQMSSEFVRHVSGNITPLLVNNGS